MIRVAQDNHYRAFEQRSKWVRETLLGITEEEDYEERLLREWANKASLALDGFEELSDKDKIVVGKKLYTWIQEAAASSPSLFIRREFISAYLARGSYHMLVDKSRMTWHPDDVIDYLQKLLEAERA